MLKLRKNRKKNLPPHSNQAQHLAHEGQANNSLITAIVALVAIIGLSLFLFYKAPLAGKAIIQEAPELIPENQAGIFLTENTEYADTPFSIEVWANIDRTTVGLSFVLDYDDLKLDGTCGTAVISELWKDFKIITCDGSKINFQDSTTNFNAAKGPEPFKIATINFEGVTTPGTYYYLNFDSFNIYDLNPPHNDFIVGDGTSKEIRIEERGAGTPPECGPYQGGIISCQDGQTCNAMNECETTPRACGPTILCPGGQFCNDSNVCENDADTDGEGFADHIDNCPLISNLLQEDSDGDGKGDACDPCSDSDGLNFNVKGTVNWKTPTGNQISHDACGYSESTISPTSGGLRERYCLDRDYYSTMQVDCPNGCSNGACITTPPPPPPCITTTDCEAGMECISSLCQSSGNDADGDGILEIDNCPDVPNTNQLNDDSDTEGNACDIDDDDDGKLDDGDGNGVIGDNLCSEVVVENCDDNCQFEDNPAQTNNDGDGQGDVCDPDDDNDQVLDGVDNCPLAANFGQAADADCDGIGDAYDTPQDECLTSADCQEDGICSNNVCVNDPSIKDGTKIKLKEIPRSGETFSTEIFAKEDLTGKELTVYTTLYGLNDKQLVLKSEKIPGLGIDEKYISRVDYPDYSKVKKKYVLVLDKFPEDGWTIHGTNTEIIN